MPTGHTTKKTLTPYRAGLLDRLRAGPVARRSVSSADRRQYNELRLFGWADDDGQNYTLTDAGADKLTAYHAAQAGAQSGAVSQKSLTRHFPYPLAPGECRDVVDLLRSGIPCRVGDFWLYPGADGVESDDAWGRPHVVARTDDLGTAFAWIDRQYQDLAGESAEYRAWRLSQIESREYSLWRSRRPTELSI